MNVLSQEALLLRGGDIDFFVEDFRHNERLVFSCAEIFLSKGEILHIVGSNGVGKTSLLRILSGLLESSGFVDLSCDDILYIGHRDGLNDSLTVWEHLCLWSDLGGGVMGDLASFAGVWFSSDLWHNSVGDCSAGERRKLSLLRLFLYRAEIWFLDEPFASLDIGVRDMFLSAFRNHCDCGGGIIMTGHNSDLSSILGGRIFALGG